MCLVQEIERMEEQKLKSKFPGAPGLVYGWWIRNCLRFGNNNKVIVVQSVKPGFGALYQQLFF